MKRQILWPLLFLVAVPSLCPALAQSKLAGGSPVLPTLAFGDISPQEAVQSLAKAVGIKVSLDRTLLFPDRTAPLPLVKARWTQVSARQALDAVLDNYGWRMEWDGNAARFLIRPRMANDDRPPVTKVDLLAIPNSGPKEEPAQSLTFEALPARDGVTQLATMAGLNIQFDPRLIATDTSNPLITDRWTNLTPKQALDAILNINGWQLTQLSNNPILRVTPMIPGMNDPRTTKVTSLPDDKPTPEIAFDGMKLTDAIRQLATLAKLNIQFDPVLAAPPDSAHPPITVTKKWTNVSAGSALLKLLEEHGWQMNRSADSPIYRIGLKSP